MPFSFVESEDFTAAWSKLGLSMDDFFRLQGLIMVDPTVRPVIPGTGGLRKIRFSKASSGKGKRGSLRVCYAYFRQLSAIILVFVYAKTAQGNLSAAEKKGVKNWLAQLERKMEASRRGVGGTT